MTLYHSLTILKWAFSPKTDLLSDDEDDDDDDDDDDDEDEGDLEAYLATSCFFFLSNSRRSPLSRLGGSAALLIQGCVNFLTL